MLRAQAPASAISFDELQGLTYLQVKGSGIANTCPVIEGGSSNLKDLKAGNYKINKLCMEPTSFRVKEESQFKGGDTDFVATKLMTRLTYTLDEVCPKTEALRPPAHTRLCTPRGCDTPRGCPPRLLRQILGNILSREQDWAICRMCGRSACR